MAEENNKTHSASGVDYDRRETRSGLIAIVAGSILAVLVVFIIGIYWLYTVSYESVEFQQYTGVSSAELQAIHDREEDHLTRYSFVDKEKGVVSASRSSVPSTSWPVNSLRAKPATTPSRIRPRKKPSAEPPELLIRLQPSPLPQHLTE